MELKTKMVLFCWLRSSKASVFIWPLENQHKKARLHCLAQWKYKVFYDKTFVSSSTLSWSTGLNDMIWECVWTRIIINKAIIRTLQNLLFARVLPSEAH